MSGEPLSAEPTPGRLLLQVAAKEPLDVLGLADRHGGGLVFTGAGAIEAVHAARRQGFMHPLLTDRRRYAGNSRVRGTAPFAQSWLAGQRQAGITPVLTDSGYIGDGDVTALRAVLRQAAEAGPGVTAVLPLHPHWLRRDAGRLSAEITAHGVPVALVLEHRGDPLGAPEAVTGLIELMNQTQPVALLATGIAALAALAFGAAFAAVGVRGSLRHLHPATSEDEPGARKARWRPAAPEIVAAPVLTFAALPAVVHACLAAEKSSGKRAWECHCASCQGRTPEWLASASALDASSHNFDVLSGHARRLLRCDRGPARRRAWQAQCREALRTYDELGLAALGFEPPRLLSACARAGAGAGAGPVARAAGLRSAG
jgi:hypothetical protein